MYWLMSDGLERTLLSFNLRYRPDFYLKKILKNIELKFSSHVSSTAKMEVLQELQISTAVSAGSCY